MTKMGLQLTLMGIHQVDIARAAGVSTAFISDVVRGKKRPSGRVITAFAARTGLPESRVIELFEGVND